MSEKRSIITGIIISALLFALSLLTLLHRQGVINIPLPQHPYTGKNHQTTLPAELQQQSGEEHLSTDVKHTPIKAGRETAAYYVGAITKSTSGYTFTPEDLHTDSPASKQAVTIKLEDGKSISFKFIKFNIEGNSVSCEDGGTKLSLKNRKLTYLQFQHNDKNYTVEYTDNGTYSVTVKEPQVPARNELN